MFKAIVLFVLSIFLISAPQLGIARAAKDQSSHGKVKSKASSQPNTTRVKGGSKVQSYLVQADAGEGVELRIAVNGLTVLERDGNEWQSGGAALNPFFRPGMNLIEIKARQLSSGTGEPRLRVVIQTRSSETPIFALDHTVDKITLPVSKSIKLSIPDFPQTDLWRAEDPGADVEKQIVTHLKSLRKELVQMVQKKDVKSIMRIGEYRTRINAVALGLEFPPGMIERQFKEQLGQEPIKLLEPPEIDDASILIRNLGSHLFEVTRRDKRPLLIVQSSDPQRPFSIGSRSAVVGKINGQWEILN